jgi:hypothetical protein
MALPFISSGAVISGDPVVALAAQVNRILERELYAPAPGQLSRDLAASAIVLMQTISIAAAVHDPMAAEQVGELTQALKDPVPYVSSRVAQMARALAIYGDQLGKPPAKEGITKRDPRFGRKWDGWMWASAIGGLGVAALGAGLAAKRLATRRA